MDSCYILSGILLDESGEEVGIRYQELDSSITVICKKDEVNDFLLSHEVYGGGDLCVARVDAKTGEVISRGHPKLISIVWFRDTAIGVNLRFQLCYLDSGGEYKDKILSLDDCLDTLHRLEGEGATVVDEYPKSESLKPYLLFMRGILYSEAYQLERSRARLTREDCSNISVYFDRETRSVRLQAIGMVGQSNGVNRYSAFVNRIEVSSNDLAQASVKVVDLSRCDRLTEIDYSGSLGSLKSDNSMTMIFPKWTTKVTDEPKLIIKTFSIGRGRFEFRNFPSGAVFKGLTVFSGAELAGEIGIFTVESAVFGTMTSYEKVHGVKKLVIRVVSPANSQILISNTDSEEINIEYSAGFAPFMPNIFSIADCYGLKSLTVVSRDCIDIPKVLSGIERCPSLSEITLIAKKFHADIDGRTIDGALKCLDYNRLKILRVLKKGNGMDFIHNKVFIQVPYDCTVECESELLASQIIRAYK